MLVPDMPPPAPGPPPPPPPPPLAPPPPPDVAGDEADELFVADDDSSAPPDFYQVAREYYHTSKANKQTNKGKGKGKGKGEGKGAKGGSEVAEKVRNDFADTLLWSAVIVTDKQGIANFTFDASDSIATYMASVDGAAMGGVLGATRVPLFSTQQPLTVSSKIGSTMEVTVGDKILLPVSLRLAPKGPISVDPSSSTAGLRGASDSGTINQQVPVSLKVVGTGTATVVRGGSGVRAANADGSTRLVDSALTMLSEAAYGSSVSLLAAVEVREPGDGALKIVGLAGAAAGDGADGAGASAGAGKSTMQDVLRQNLVVRAGGFPQSKSLGGLISSDTHDLSKTSPTKLELTTPSDTIAGSMKVTASFYPSPAATLTSALEALLFEPCGCFEQASATTYPIVMALQYFMAHSGVKAEVKEKAIGLLERGYEKLISYETKGGGYEWFGGAPAHEGLTAYGILQFHDMKKVLPDLVDDAMLQRTTDWLFTRRALAEEKTPDASVEGSSEASVEDSVAKDSVKSAAFLVGRSGLDSFGFAPPLTTDAYIVYSLVRSGYASKLGPEIAHLSKQCAQPDYADPYVLGLLGGVYYHLATTTKSEDWLVRARSLTDRVVKLQQVDGSVLGAVSSITSSRGDALTIEATAVAVIVMLDDYEKYVEQTEKAIRWLTSRCEKGRFGSTQATVLSLKAIVAYDMARAAKARPATATLRVDGKVVATGRVGDGDSGGGEAVELGGAEVDATLSVAGDHAVEVELAFDAVEGATGDAKEEEAASMPFSIDAVWSVTQPSGDQDRGCAVSLSTSLSNAGGKSDTRAYMTEGEIGEITVTVKAMDAPSGAEAQAESGAGEHAGVEALAESKVEVKAEAMVSNGLPMVVAIVGIPSSLEVDDARLKLIKKEGLIDFYERLG